MKKWIAVDWGTSTFRAYLVQNNEVSDTIESKDGRKVAKERTDRLPKREANVEA